jgi:hypothetical protein
MLVPSITPSGRSMGPGGVFGSYRSPTGVGPSRSSSINSSQAIPWLSASKLLGSVRSFANSLCASPWVAKLAQSSSPSRPPPPPPASSSHAMPSLSASSPFGSLGLG